jgi:hypothetical protein
MKTKPFVIAIFSISTFTDTDALGQTGTTPTSVVSKNENLGASVLLGGAITVSLVEKNNGVEINWSVSGSNDHTAFEIERSKDGVNFSRVASIPSSFRNNAAYSYFDNNLPLTNNIFYRLRQCKVGNQCVYSETKSLKITSQKFLKIYPLSNGNVFRVMYTATDASDVLMQLYKNNGTEVYREKRKVVAGLNEFDITIDGLPRGLYVLKVIEGDKFESRSFVR